jgi:hypothetical protein
VDVLRSHATHAEFVFCRAGSFCTVQVCAPGLEVRVSFALIIILRSPIFSFFFFIQGMDHARTVLVNCRLPIKNIDMERFTVGVNLRSLHRILRRCEPEAEAEVRVTKDGAHLEIMHHAGAIWKIPLCDLDSEHFKIPMQDTMLSCLVCWPQKFVASLCAHALVLSGSGSRWCNVRMNPTSVQLTVVQENGGGEEGVHGSTRWDADCDAHSGVSAGGVHTVAHQPMLSFFRRIPVSMVRSIRVQSTSVNTLHFLVCIVGGGELCLVLAASIR